MGRRVAGVIAIACSAVARAQEPAAAPPAPAAVSQTRVHLTALSTDDLLPAGGLGIYLLSRQNHINFRADYAWGKSGSKGVYLGVGEAF